MKNRFCASLLLFALTAGVPALAASLEEYELPAPAMTADKPGREETDRKLLEQTERDQHNSLLERQMRQLELLQQQAQRDKARAEKLKQIESKNQS